MVEEKNKKNTMSQPLHRERNSSYTNLFWLALVVAILATILYAILFYNIKSKAERVGEILNAIEAEVKKNQEFEAIGGVLKETKTLRTRINEYFIFSDGVVGAIERIEGLGERAGVALLIDSANIEGDTNQVLKLQFRAGGSFESLFYLLSLLNSLPLQLSFERVSIDKKEGDGAGDSVLPGAWVGAFTLSIESFLNEERGDL